MSQQEERNYQTQMAKAYNWLKEYSLGHEWFGFKTAEQGQYLFQGRGEWENPPTMFYVEIFQRRENYSYVVLDFYLNRNKDAITTVRFHIGWFLQRTKTVLDAYRRLAENIKGRAVDGQSCRVLVGENQDEVQVKNALFDWLNEHAKQLQKVDEEYHVQLERRQIGRLCHAGLLSENDERLGVPENAEFGSATQDVAIPIAQGEKETTNNQGNKMNNDTDAPPEIPRNRIVFGAPGTGKSRRLKKEAEKSFTEANSERVTFYATYSYAQFVGSYKPVMKDVGGEEKISYEFVPGPFLRMLVNALKNPKEKFLLIIEEINRANAAAVFGDMFQLLDRDAEGKGKSEYAVATSEDIRRYLVKEGLDADAVKKIQIPANLYLWATMNSADQGVFPLDTAFKRRWSFKYIGIDDGEPQAPDLKIQIKNQTYDWKTLRKFLNRLLVLNGVNEDKLMGPFFLKNASEFNAKVLMYLWEDAARMCRRAVFGEIMTYSELCDEWEEKGIEIFDVAKFDDTKLNGCREALQQGENPPTKDDAAPAQETNNN